MKKPFATSVIRLIIGVLLILIWWLPLWTIGPQLSLILGFDPNHTRIIIIGVQTVIGFIGAFIVGKQVAAIVKKTPLKKRPGVIWKALRYGSIE
jgi:hypothetical protein